MGGTKRLFLPGGGSFDIPIPGGQLSGAVVSSTPVWIPVLGGLLLGGLTIWGISRLIRN
jgi:hypothetical protein